MTTLLDLADRAQGTVTPPTAEIRRIAAATWTLAARRTEERAGGGIGVRSLRRDRFRDGDVDAGRPSRREDQSGEGRPLRVGSEIVVRSIYVGGSTIRALRVTTKLRLQGSALAAALASPAVSSALADVSYRTGAGHVTGLSVGREDEPVNVGRARESGRQLPEGPQTPGRFRVETRPNVEPHGRRTPPPQYAPPTTESRSSRCSVTSPTTAGVAVPKVKPIDASAGIWPVAGDAAPTTAAATRITASRTPGALTNRG